MLCNYTSSGMFNYTIYDKLSDFLRFEFYFHIRYDVDNRDIKIYVDGCDVQLMISETGAYITICQEVISTTNQ